MSTEVTQTPENSAQLAELIESLTVFDHDGGSGGYEQSADAMWKAAVAAFEYAARKVQPTGFQGSWAALKFYGEVMHIKSPFMVIDLDQALYPQYDLLERVSRFIAEGSGWLAEQAKAKLAEDEARASQTYTDSDGNEQPVLRAHPNVVAHWRSLAEGASA